MKRKEILGAAIRTVCTDREGQYGSPEDNFSFIASLWSEYLSHLNNGGEKLTGADVAVMMALLKIARITTGKYKDDNYIDLAGYAACGAELASREVVYDPPNNTEQDKKPTTHTVPSGLFMKDGVPLARCTYNFDDFIDPKEDIDTISHKYDQEYIKQLSIAISLLTEELEKTKDELAEKEKNINNNKRPKNQM